VTAVGLHHLHRGDLGAAGVHVNFLDAEDDTSRVREAYGDNTYRRLAQVKAKYDPDNAFHNNKTSSRQALTT